MLEKFGMAMGPFRVADLAGLDIGWQIRKARAAQNPKRSRPHVADGLCEQNRFGQKTGAGYYRYEAGRRDAIPDPIVDELIIKFREQNGIKPRKISDKEILERCVFALVNEGARILEEGIAQRASDIDMVYLTGYGFPLFRGGPCSTPTAGAVPRGARSRSAYKAQTGDKFWEPAALIKKLAAEGKSFNG